MKHVAGKLISDGFIILVSFAPPSRIFRISQRTEWNECFCLLSSRSGSCMWFQFNTAIATTCIGFILREADIRFSRLRIHNKLQRHESRTSCACLSEFLCALKGSHKSNTGISHIPFAQPISILFNSLSRLINCRSFSFSIPMCLLFMSFELSLFSSTTPSSCHSAVLCTKLLIALWTHIECATTYVLHAIYFNS